MDGQDPNATPSVRPEPSNDASASELSSPPAVAPPPPPPRSIPDPASIPIELRQRAHWMCWRYQRSGDNWTKVPVNARTGRSASTTDASTWTTFEEALARAQRDKGLAGVGFVFAKDDPFTGIDLDDCIDGEGVISPEAKAIINRAVSYAEISPSGHGVKIFVQGAKTLEVSSGGPFPGMSKIEVYDRARYFTVTGTRVPGTPEGTHSAQPIIDDLCERIRTLKNSEKKWKPHSDTKSQNGWRPTRELGDPLAPQGEVLLRASKYLAKIPAAISGQGGHSQTYAAATALVHGFGLDEQTALELLRSEYNPRCQPTWSDAELLHKVRDAATKPHEKPWGWLRDNALDLTRHTPQGAGIAEALQTPGVNLGARVGDSADEDPGGKELRPEIILTVEEHRVVDQAIVALAGDDTMYQRGNVLVRVDRGQALKDGVRRSETTGTIAEIPIPSLRERLTKFATLKKMKVIAGERKLLPAHPPPWLVNAVHARGDWPGIRPLNAVSDAPVFRADGSIWQTAGYDAVTGVFFEPKEEFPVIPEGVTIDDADEAISQLMEVVQDFKFESDCHRSAWAAGLLTPLARFAFCGPAPLFLVDANIRAAGKGLLVDTFGRICLGRAIPVSSYSHEPEEMRKKITAITLAGDRLVLLDNIDGPFGNDALDRALTGTMWRDRLLSRSEMVEMPLFAVWYATGNNVAVGADTTRRVIHIRLDVLDERPEERSGFKHPKLLEWTTQNRARLLTQALTVLKAYCNAGRPSQSLSAYGSYEGWSSLVREALVWAGLPDPCETRRMLTQASDTTTEQLTQLMEAWRNYDPLGDGLVLFDLLARLYSRDYPQNDDASIAMRAALENMVNSPPGKPPSPRQVGARLKHFRRRVICGRYFDNVFSGRSGATWQLCKANQGEDL